MFQANGAAAPVLLFKIQDIFNGGSPKPINTLVVITNDADIFISACQQGCQQILGMVGILILIHQHIAEFSLVVASDILVFLQKFDCHINQVIKIQSIIVFQAGLVLQIGFGNVFRSDIPILLCPVQHFLWGNHFIFFFADSSQDILWRKGFIIQSHIPDNFFHNPLRISGIVNRKTFGVAHPLDIPPKNAAAGGMKGHRPNILCTFP